MSLRYVPTRQRDRYRVFDGPRFLGVVERQRFGHRRAYLDDLWTFSGAEKWYRTPEGQRTWPYQKRWILAYLFDTRTEAVDALREMRQG